MNAHQNIKVGSIMLNLRIVTLAIVWKGIEMLPRKCWISIQNVLQIMALSHGAFSEYVDIYIIVGKNS